VSREHHKADRYTVEPDLFSAIEARDEALAQVSRNAGLDWMGGALLRIAAFRNWRGTAEDVRVTLLANSYPSPHHHNAWGALIKTAIKRKLIIPTGDLTNMKTKKSHARRTPVYRSAA
jgi:hypothetical protein